MSNASHRTGKYSISPFLAYECAKSPQRVKWLDELEGVIDALAKRWSLSPGDPFEGEDAGNCSWVAPATLNDGTVAILKLGMPHMEAEHEIAGLRMLNGDPTVLLLDVDEDANAMLLERCDPGSSLRELFQPEQDIVIAGLLKRFWRKVPDDSPIRPLSAMIAFWMEETMRAESSWHDAGLVNEGLRTFDHLLSSSMSDTLLATDLHAGNVLRARREPWLVIDPKPFVGDPTFDATQHLLNCRARLRTDARDTARRFSDLLEVDYDRVRLWLFARLAAEPRDDWDDEATALARILSI